MASQAGLSFQGQPSVSKAGPAKPTDPGVEQFKNVTRDNAVTFRASYAVSIHDYIDFFTNVQPAKEEISASRISNGRIAIYLSSREAALDAVQQGLDIDGVACNFNRRVNLSGLTKYGHLRNVRHAHCMFAHVRAYVASLGSRRCWFIY